MADDYLIEAEELYSLNKDRSLLVVDTRDEPAYARGHIPNAVNIPQIFTYLCTDDTGGLPGLAKTFSGFFGKAGITRHQEVVIYEDALDNGYGQSCRGWFILKYLGHAASVNVLHGGIRAWNAHKLPLTHEKTIEQPVSYEPQIDSSWVVTRDQVMDAINNPSIALVDVRDYAEWIGANSSPYGYDYCPRKGRIPGALWLEWYRLMSRKGGIPYFKSPEETIEVLKQAEIPIDKQLIVYCFKGARTSNTTLALRRAGIQTKNYFSSWNEWSRILDLPVEEDYPQASLPAF